MLAVDDKKTRLSQTLVSHRNLLKPREQGPAFRGICTIQHDECEQPNRHMESNGFRGQ